MVCVMKRLASIVAILALCLTGTAQVNVQLRGTGENLAGKEVELYCYDDMLTMAERLLDRAEADSTGAFELGCYLTYPRMVFVQVERYSQTFYAEPGRTYEVFLPEFRWEQDEERNVLLDPVALPLQFMNVAPDELNLRILQFDTAVEGYLDRHRVHFDPKFKPGRAWMDSLETTVRSVCGLEGGAPGTDFFGRYAAYTLAEMRFAMRFASRKTMFERYLAGRTVLYHDENYMRLALGLMDGMVSLGTQRLPKWKLTEWVAAANLDTYLDSLGTDPLLQDEQLRELAALVALKESYYDADYDRAGVHRMVEQLAGRTKFADHAELAVRLEQSFRRAEQGEEVTTAFLLPDSAGHSVSLDSLLGKWIYLSFVRVGNPVCQRELQTMAHFRDSVYALGNVEFVSVCCDRDPQKMRDFLQGGRRGHSYHWLWLHFDGDYRLLERFGVTAYPTFHLINPEGKLHYSVTPPPASGIFLHAPWQPAAPPAPRTLPFLYEE